MSELEDNMSVSLMFTTGLVTTLVMATLVIVALLKPLEHVLTDLCGSASRARFWSIFSAVSIAMVPLVFALGYDTLNRFTPPLLQIAAQVRWGLIGLLMTVVGMAWILSRWIARHVPKA